jgi:hypothetical protein
LEKVSEFLSGAGCAVLFEVVRRGGFVDRPFQTSEGMLSPGRDGIQHVLRCEERPIRDARAPVSLEVSASFCIRRVVRSSASSSQVRRSLHLPNLCDTCGCI